MRNAPILEKRKKIYPLKEFSVVDIETKKWIEFIVLGCFDGTQYREFRSMKKFFDFLKTGQGPEVYFAHFGGKFDFMFILREALRDQTVKVETIIPRGSSLLMIKIQIRDRSIIFRDSAALLPFALKTLTDEFGVETKKGDWDHTKTRGYSKGLAAYLKSDCVGLHQVLSLFFSQDLLKDAQLSYTIAGQSMEVFRSTLHDRHLESLTGSAERFCRPAYLGGRTEIFRPIFKGKKGKKLFEYDVNSLYPFVLKEFEYPCGRPYFTKDFEKGFLGIYHAKVEAPPDLYLPVLGIIHEGKFIFPVGKFEGKWTSEELKLALSKGYKIEIVRGLVFPKKSRYFAEFIATLYAIRLQSKKGSVQDISAKLFMNSLYGRLGLNPEKEAITFQLKEGVKPFSRIKVGHRYVEIFKEPFELNTFRNVALACFVTSYARIHLYHLMDRVQDSLYYCDTDSIFTTKELPTGPDLGRLKLEAKHDSAVFLLPKTYSLEGLKRKIRMKGFEKKKTEEFSHDDFFNYFDGELKRLRAKSPAKFATFKTALKLGKLVALTKESFKEVRARYDKREIVKQDDGTFNTIPRRI